MSSLTVSTKSNKQFEIHPAGVYAARCTRVVDLGTQQTTYKGQAKSVRKVMLAFESEHLMTEGEYEGQPFLITARYTLSLSEKAQLRGFLEGWRGRKFSKQEEETFEFKNVLGKPAYLNLVHSEPDSQGKVYCNIQSAMPLPAQMTAPAAQGKLVFFSLQAFDQEAFDSLSDGLKETISKSPEFQAIKKGGGSKPPTDEIPDDDIPF